MARKNTAVAKVEAKLATARKGAASARNALKATQSPMGQVRTIGGNAVGGGIVGAVEAMFGEKPMGFPAPLAVAAVSFGAAVATGSADLAAVAGGAVAVESYKQTKAVVIKIRAKKQAA